MFSNLCIFKRERSTRNRPADEEPPQQPDTASDTAANPRPDLRRSRVRSTPAAGKKADGGKRQTAPVVANCRLRGCGAASATKGSPANHRSATRSAERSSASERVRCAVAASDHTELRSRELPDESPLRHDPQNDPPPPSESAAPLQGPIAQNSATAHAPLLRYYARARRRSATIASWCSIAQPISASTWGSSECARSVRAYSTRGGISG